MNKIVFLIIISMALISCEKEVFPKLETQNNLIVEGGYYQELESGMGYCEIKLTESLNFLADSKEASIEDALLTLEIENDLFDIPHLGNGVYRLDGLYAEIEQSLNLQITYEGNVYTATDVLANGTALDSINTIFFEPPFGSGAGSYPAINMTDVPEETNFYLWQLYINDTLRMVPSPGNVFRLTLSDEFWDGQSLESYLPSDNFPVFPGDTIEYFQYGINEQYYNFLKAVYNITSSNPLLGDPPPGDVRGNITCETNSELVGLGYFSTSTYSRKVKIVE